MTLTITERVAAGAAWLDEHKPGWAARIDLNRLDLNHCGRCVLGQLFGSYYNAPLAGGPSVGRHDEVGAALGFTITDEEMRIRWAGSGEPFDDLLGEWFRLIEERRAVIAP